MVWKHACVHACVCEIGVFCLGRSCAIHLRFNVRKPFNESCTTSKQIWPQQEARHFPNVREVFPLILSLSLPTHPHPAPPTSPSLQTNKTPLHPRDWCARRAQGDRWHTPTSLPPHPHSPISSPHCNSPPAQEHRWRSSGPDQCHSVSLESG